VALAVTSLVCQ